MKRMRNGERLAADEAVNRVEAGADHRILFTAGALYAANLPGAAPDAVQARQQARHFTARHRQHIERRDRLTRRQFLRAGRKRAPQACVVEQMGHAGRAQHAQPPRRLHAAGLGCGLTALPTAIDKGFEHTGQRQRGIERARGHGTGLRRGQQHGAPVGRVDRRRASRVERVGHAECVEMQLCGLVDDAVQLQPEGRVDHLTRAKVLDHPAHQGMHAALQGAGQIQVAGFRSGLTLELLAAHPIEIGQVAEQGMHRLQHRALGRCQRQRPVRVPGFGETVDLAWQGVADQFQQRNQLCRRKAFISQFFQRLLQASYCWFERELLDRFKPGRECCQRRLHESRLTPKCRALILAVWRAILRRSIGARDQ